MNFVEERRLTTTQARELGDRVRPMLVFLLHLKDRMLRAGFPPDGELYRVASKAHDAVHHLSVVLHYESCKSGVGLKPKDD